MHPLLKTQLKQSQQFASTYDAEGQLIVFDFAHPEQNFHASEMVRVLLSCFPGDRAVQVSDAIRTYCGHCGVPEQPDTVDVLLAAVAQLLRSGVLVEQQEWSGPYSPEMCSHYAHSRQVPPEICARIVEAANVQRETDVLDLGSGSGSIAVQMGMVSARVTGTDISEVFLNMARGRAQSQASHAKFARMDGNKLVFGTSNYDVITASQVLHWLDPAWAVRALYRSLRPGGSLFVIETKPVLWAGHPFRQLLALGNLRHSTVLKECTRHAKDNMRLFARLRPPPFHLNLAGMWVFRQTRPFGIDFARAYFFPEQVRAALPGRESPWHKLEELLEAIPPSRINGDLHWLLLQFKKQTGPQAHGVKLAPQNVLDIPYQPWRRDG